MTKRACSILAGAAACTVMWIGGCDWAGSENTRAASRRTIEVSVSGSDPAPAIELAPNRVATVSFANGLGEPWPVAELAGGEADGLTYRRVESHPHMVLVQSDADVSTNLVAVLKGLAVPDHLRPAAHRRPGRCRCCAAPPACAS